MRRGREWKTVDGRQEAEEGYVDSCDGIEGDEEVEIKLMI